MEYQPKCFGEGNDHKPDYLIQLYKIEKGSNGKEVAFSWCKECGAVSVDQQYDGRFNSTIVKMQFPKVLGLLKKILESNESK